MKLLKFVVIFLYLTRLTIPLAHAEPNIGFMASEDHYSEVVKLKKKILRVRDPQILEAINETTSLYLENFIDKATTYQDEAISSALIRGLFFKEDDVARLDIFVPHISVRVQYRDYDGNVQTYGERARCFVTIYSRLGMWMPIDRERNFAQCEIAGKLSPLRSLE